MVRRAFCEPDRGRARRHHAQRSHRQGPSARPFGPRQELLRTPRRGQRKARSSSHMLRIVPRRRSAATRRWRTPTSSRPRLTPELIENIIPIGQRRTILELTEQTCRWPIGDPGSTRILLLRRQYDRRPCPIARTTRASPISRRPTAAARDARCGEASSRIASPERRRTARLESPVETAAIVFQLALPKRSSSE